MDNVNYVSTSWEQVDAKLMGVCLNLVKIAIDIEEVTGYIDYTQEQIIDKVLHTYDRLSKHNKTTYTITTTNDIDDITLSSD